MIIENGKAVFRTPAGELRLVAPADALRAQSELGWSEATPEDIQRDDARKQGAAGTLATVGEEAIRTAASAASVLPGVDAGRAPEGLTDLEPGQTETPLTAVYSDPSLARREVNPTAAALGSQLAVAPAYAAGGIGALIAADLALGAAQEATDAEIERRGISGMHVLRNGALNLAFSGAAAGIPLGARALLTGTENVVQRGAARAASMIEQRGLKAIEKRAQATFSAAESALEKAKPPKVANNPATQRAAMMELALAFQKAEPAAAARLADLVSASPQARYSGLRQLREEASGELADALEAKLARSELWGERTVRFASDVDQAKLSRPPTGAPLETWRAYSEALRRIPGAKFEKLADQLDEYATARAIDVWGESAAKAATGRVGKAAAGKAAGIAGGAVGGLFGGWPGAFAGKLAGDALEPLAEQAMRGAAPRLQEGFVRAAEFLKAVGQSDRQLTARLLVDTRSATKFLRLAESPAYPIDRFRGDHETLTQAFMASRAAVEGYDANPVELLDTIADQFGDVDQQSPRLFREMLGKTIEIQRFLRSKLPPRRGVSVARPEGSPPSPFEMRQYALFHTAALDPESVWADARAGRLRREQVETLKTLWAPEYEEMRNMVIAELGNGRSTPATRQRLSLLFDLGGSIEPAIGPRARALVERMRQQVPRRAERAPTLTRAEPRSKTTMTPGGMASAQLGLTMGA